MSSAGVHTMSSQQAGWELAASPTELAWLVVVAGSLRCWVRPVGLPSWRGVRFDPRLVMQVKRFPAEVDKARREAAQRFPFRTVTMQRAVALGAVLKHLEQHW